MGEQQKRSGGARGRKGYDDVLCCERFSRGLAGLVDTNVDSLASMFAAR